MSSYKTEPGITGREAPKKARKEFRRIIYSIGGRSE